MRSLQAQIGGLLLAIGCGTSLSCSAPLSPGQRLLDSAREMNTASRFGRMDVAAEHAEPTSKQDFLRRRKSWGDDVRVLDIEVAQVEIKDPGHAEVRVEVAWTRMNDGLLHNTTLQQRWQNTKTGRWALHSEERTAGDWGLLGEPVPAHDTSPPRDVHFATKSLGALP